MPLPSDLYVSRIPAWDEFMVPVLKIQDDGETRVLRDLITLVSDLESLSVEQRQETLSSGQQVVANRVGWAASYLARVGALERPGRGKYVITTFGRELLSKHPKTITEADLRAVAKPDDQWWVSKAKIPGEGGAKTDLAQPAPNHLDPLEMISQGIECEGRSY